jgi:hypothetical protein
VFDVAIWTLLIPPLDTSVRLADGGPTLGLQEMRHYTYEATELPAPKTQEEADLQAEVQRKTVDYFLEKLSLVADKPARVLSAAEISESAEEYAALVERTLKRGRSTRKKD